MLFRRILVFVFPLLYALSSYSQVYHNSDSLKNILRLTRDEHTKARIILKIAANEELRDPKLALVYARQALRIAQLTGYDSAEVRALIQIGINLSRLNLLKETLDVGEQVVEKASRYNMQLEIADGRDIMAVAYAQAGDFDNSSKLYFENLKIYEKLNEKRLMGRTLGNIGADFGDQGSYIKALDYTNRALKIGLEINDLTLVTDQYNNLAAIYQVGFNDFNQALENYKKALSVAVKIEDIQQKGTILLNMGRVYMWKNNMDTAFSCLEQSLSIFQELHNPGLIADNFTALGSYYCTIGDNKAGKKYALKGLTLGKENGILQTILDAAEILHKISIDEKDTANAYKYHIILTDTKDSLNFLQNQNELFKLEFKYNQEKIAKEQKNRQQRNYFIMGFVILGLLSGLMIVLLFNSRQKIKIKNTLLEKDKAEADLNFKTKELSTNLLALLKKNDLIAEIGQKLTELIKSPSRTDLREAVIRLNHEIKQSSDDRLWQEFSVQFKETNSEFYSKLLQRYPDLTQSELKLCAYLRLNMTTKEIADLTGQRPETLGTARYRLRKKFGLTNSESNLVTFLTQI